MKKILIMGLLGALFGQTSCKTKKVDLSNVYPYIITEHYLIDGLKEETVIIDTLGYGLYVTLVYDMKGLASNVKVSDLKSSEISNQVAYERALKNLDSVLDSNKISITKFNGPNGIPFLIFADHWLSAVTILNPKIKEFCQKNLESDTIYASIPHRDVMLVFPNCTPEQLEDFRKMVIEMESDGAKPLAFGLFRMDDKALVPID